MLTLRRDAIALPHTANELRQEHSASQALEILMFVIMVGAVGPTDPATYIRALQKRFLMLTKLQDFGTLISDLKACGTSRNIQRGKLIHQAVVEHGLHSDVYIASTLISMYGKCGCMDAAHKVFNAVKHPDVVCWNALVLGYADNGQGETGLQLLLQMHHEGFLPNARTLVATLKACVDLQREEQRGTALHLLAGSFGCSSDIYLKNTLVGMYARCGNLEEARAVFDGIEYPNIVSWNALILGYATNGKGRVALDLFSRMEREGFAANERTFVAAIKACGELAIVEARVASIQRGNALLLLACRAGCDTDVYVENILVDMYASCGSMEDARRVFDKVRHPNVVCWNSLILGYVDNAEAQVALDLFWKMVQEGNEPDAVTFVAALKACAELAAEEKRDLNVAKQLHLLVLGFGCDSNIFVQATLVDLYAKSRSMKHARKIFDGAKNQSLVCWNALITGYAENGQGDTALDLLAQMQREGLNQNRCTFVAVLKGIAAKEDRMEQDVQRVKRLHMLIARRGCGSDIYVQSSLVDAYSKCGSMENACKVFSSMEQLDVVSWTAIISGYADSGQGRIALDLFLQMKREGCAPDSGCFVAALKACSLLGALEMGRALHTEICSYSMETDVVLRNCLVSFYAKCGSLREARQVFDSHVTRDLLTWNALIAGYSRHGEISSVFDLFDEMQSAGLKPDGVTLKCVLVACSHAGLVDIARKYFELMLRKFCIAPELEHYNCIIDSLGRANMLEDAMAMLRSMPFTPNAVTWTTVLGACREWRKVELGTLAFQAVTSLDDEKAQFSITSSYFLLRGSSVRSCNQGEQD